MNVHTKEVKRLQCLPTDKRVNKRQNMRALNYYSVIKNEALTQATTWMNGENVMLYERSRLQKKSHII